MHARCHPAQTAGDGVTGWGRGVRSERVAFGRCWVLGCGRVGGVAEGGRERSVCGGCGVWEMLGTVYGVAEAGTEGGCTWQGMIFRVFRLLLKWC